MEATMSSQPSDAPGPPEDDRVTSARLPSIFCARALLASLLVILCVLLGLVPTRAACGNENNSKRKWGSFEYVNPRPNAMLVSAFTTIAVRRGSLIQTPLGPASYYFEVTGSKSGKHHHKGELRVGDDQKTVLFRPRDPFVPGEKVYVKVLKGLTALEDGRSRVLDEYEWSFYISRMPIKEYWIKKMEQGYDLHDYDHDFDRQLVHHEDADGDDGVEEETTSRALADEANDDLTYIAPDPSYRTLPADFPKIAVTFPASESTGKDDLIFVGTLFMRTNKEPDKKYVGYGLILDETGDPVFYKPFGTNEKIVDWRVNRDGHITYVGVPWSYYIGLDRFYEPTKRYQAQHGYKINSHGIEAFANGSFVCVIYDEQPVDMTRYDTKHGKKDTKVVGSIVQEVDGSGNVLNEWRSWDAFPLPRLVAESTSNVSERYNRFDALHVNSIDFMPDHTGDILLSFRHRDELIRVDRSTMDVCWRLGGVHGDFAFDREDIDYDGRPFRHQHDARVHPPTAHHVRRTANRTIDSTASFHVTMFDNGNKKSRYHRVHRMLIPKYSRAVEYAVDETNRVAHKVWEYRHDPDYYGIATGSVQRRDNGNTVINWGGLGIYPTLPFLTELDGHRNEVLLQMAFKEDYGAYRVTRQPWWGRSKQPPTVVLNRDVPFPYQLHVSYNGVTNVVSWEVFRSTAADGSDEGKIIEVPKTRFETIMPLPVVMSECVWYRVRARAGPIDAGTTVPQPSIMSEKVFGGATGREEACS
ncbi:unnamed protein product [Vitrella brassicaformis CCMP3155]|uniref:Fibronectin type-III domain-containing protein n=1 Tax=Vitrella brassicaformis (strain CCMP3155) TaxID=1169540 RepID=A0A0G4EZ29_VITBC|nr:unnamed protein product [Vitrella brassicaformis CCMP3155]|eukprot:CEM04246.1 unnamed protein product [Vitrella brassicaformis CCMP3155]